MLSGRSWGADWGYEFKTDGETDEHDYSLGGGACESRSSISSDGAGNRFYRANTTLAEVVFRAGSWRISDRAGFSLFVITVFGGFKRP